jgi:flagellar basal body-associated protein FliL
LEDPAKSHLMANVITLAGVLAWIALMVVLVMLLSVIMGWR